MISSLQERTSLEFHHKTQGNETIEQLGLGIQQLGRKAFPSITGKEFDRLLKGRFYQALLVKWQRKLGPPKADESLLVEDSVTLPLQVNGKRRGEITVPADISKDEAEKLALADPSVIRSIEGLTVRKVIVVPGRIINIVAS